MNTNNQESETAMDTSKTGRRYDYHFVVSVPLWVTDNGEVTEVGDVQLEDNPWACGDMEVWMPEWEEKFPMRGDGWMRVSPADHDDQDIPVAFGKGWSAAMAALDVLLCTQPNIGISTDEECE